MKRTHAFIVTVVGVSLLAASCTQGNTSTQSMYPSPTQTPKTTEATQVNPQDPPHSTQSAPPMAAGRYEAYSAETLSAAHAAGKKVVLFFHADWCPFCVEADKQFKARISELPENTVIFKTNYDTEIALKKQYAVTYQHTFVQIDTDGQLVSKWNGGDVENLKKFLK